MLEVGLPEPGRGLVGVAYSLQCRLYQVQCKKLF